MTHYTLEVSHEGRAGATAVATAARADEVITEISRLLQLHPDCHRIRIFFDATHIFSVDCTGATVAE